MDVALERILSHYRTWAVVGCSPDPSRTTHRVAAYLRDSGDRVIPVHPAADEILGERCFSSLSEIPAEEGVEVVDSFRRSELTGAHVDEAIAISARAVWPLRLGVAQRPLDRRLE